LNIFDDDDYRDETSGEIETLPESQEITPRKAKNNATGTSIGKDHGEGES